MKFRMICLSMIYLSLAALCIGFISACDSSSGCGTETNMPEILISSDQVPSTENAALTSDGRIFFIGGTTVYELLAQSGGGYGLSVILEREDCAFGGLTAKGTKLYGGCVVSTSENWLGLPIADWSELVQIDLSKDEGDPNRIVSARIGAEELYPNGMAVAENGDIYISNTAAGMTSMVGLDPDETPAMIRARITNQTSFTVQTQEVISSADTGDKVPNGIQIRGSRLWYVMGNELYEAQVTDAGLSNMQLIYSVSSSRLFDDFAVLSDNTLVMCEYDDPTALLSSSAPSQLTYVSTQAGQVGNVINEYLLDESIDPSSATTIVDAQGEGLYVTDFYNGGLYRALIDLGD